MVDNYKYVLTYDLFMSPHIISKPGCWHCLACMNPVRDSDKSFHFNSMFPEALSCSICWITIYDSLSTYGPLLLHACSTNKNYF